MLCYFKEHAMYFLKNTKNGHAMNETISRTSLIVGLLLSAASLPGCAVEGNSPTHKAAPVETADQVDLPGPDNHDPLEPFNRGIFRFNEVVDGLVLKPAAHIYRGVLPNPVRNGVHNALTNLSAPVVFINSAFQGDDQNMGRTFGRFLLNSTLGVAGIFDIASDMGIPKEHKKDFGQTMGVHGVSSGAYLTLPLLGPSSTRDAFGMVTDFAMDPFSYIFTTPTNMAISGTRVVDRRAELLPLSDRIYRDSLDPYASIRSIYQQNRMKVVDNYLSTDTGAVETPKKK